MPVQHADQKTPKLRTDIQAILTVLGRRTGTDKEEERQRLDLVRSQLNGVILAEGAHLERALLAWAQLQGAYLVDAQLQGADLIEAHLDRAYLQRLIMP